MPEDEQEAFDREALELYRKVSASLVGQLSSMAIADAPSASSAAMAALYAERDLHLFRLCGRGSEGAPTSHETALDPPARAEPAYTLRNALPAASNSSLHPPDPVQRFSPRQRQGGRVLGRYERPKPVWAHRSPSKVETASADAKP